MPFVADPSWLHAALFGTSSQGASSYSSYAVGATDFNVQFLKEEEPMINDFLIGADPEFVIIRNGQQVNLTYELGQNGEIGWDHNGNVAEIRPKPAHGTYQLLKNIQTLLLRPEWARIVGKRRAGAYVEFPGRRLPLGGHVHFGYDPFAAGEYSSVHLARVKALDHLTHRLEALDILPQKECERRRAGEYGRFGDVRMCSNPNGSYHPEYRTMASWLYDPRVAYICLTGAKLAAAEPEASTELLGRFHNFESLCRFFKGFAHKDQNAARACDKVLSLGHKAITADPEADFPENWRVLPL